MHSTSTPCLLSEAELLRRANLTHFRAGKLRAEGKLVPDQTAQGGRVRLYRPERVAELAAGSSTANRQA